MRNDPAWVDYLTAIATALGALAAGWAAWAAAQAARQAAKSTAASVDLVKIERERWEADRGERSRADLTFHSRSDDVQVVGAKGVGSSAWWELRNRGPSPAWNVELESDHPSIERAIERFPIDYLGVDEVLDLPNDWVMSESERVVITLRWTDGAGEHTQERDLGPA